MTNELKDAVERLKKCLNCMAATGDFDVPPDLNDIEKLIKAIESQEQDRREPAKRVGDDWIDYLKASGNFERYEGNCGCYKCEETRDGYFVWKASKDKREQQAEALEWAAEHCHASVEGLRIAAGQIRRGTREVK